MTAYLIKKDYGIELGPYRMLSDESRKIVVIDLVNHVWHRHKQLPHAIENPFVVYRDLIQESMPQYHGRYMIRLSDFKQIFVKE